MSYKQPQTGSINRRKMMGAALFGGAVAGAAMQPGNAFGQEKPKTTTPGAKPASPAIGPNLSPPVVAVKAGKLRGLREGKTYSFLGVRYAEAERFGQPKPVQPWEGIKNAQAWGPVCPIPLSSNVGPDEVVFPHRFWVPNENCQYLNVWTQNLNPAVKKPVMVWMHGGGFTNGSSMEAYAYDGRSLSEFGDVVAVSVNHRLNIIGTLDLSAYGPEYANSRQTGMADLVAALEWVHHNIETFGGDPGNVMIFGQSGGGGKVVRLMHMPAAQGFFHKVSAQSGSANYRNTDPATSIRTQQAVAAATLKNLNLTGSEIDKLKAVPYLELLAAGTAAGQTVARELGVGNVGWNPIADDQYVMREFCDWAEKIPVMSGTVFSEMQGTLTRGDGRKNEWTQTEIDEHLTAAFGDKKNDIVTEFKQAFPRKKVQDVLYYAGASRSGSKSLLARKLEKGKTPVYNYLFAWEYPINGGITAFHCSELAFCFHALNVPQIKTATGGGPVAMALQDKVAGAWVNFAKTGNPSQPGLEWRPYTPDNPQAMVFDTISESRPLHDDKLASLLPAVGGRGGRGGRG
ncbi:MAG: carboxylesterase family protein [Bryobacteraceae bacterium]|jgi:para-nitrobenzyl esterase